MDNYGQFISIEAEQKIKNEMEPNNDFYNQEDDSEIYLFLGTRLSTHFFFHSIYNKNFNDKISYQIYNTLINNEFITDPVENVIIYEFDLDKNICYVICIYHFSNPKLKEFSKTSLEDLFQTLILTEREELYIIKYNYYDECYFTYFTCGDIDFILNNEYPKTKLEINNIYNILTSKPFIK